jgi:hypothetical protein
LAVSEADGHLNALANDIVARQLVRFLIGSLPTSTGFGQVAWLDAMRSLPQRLIESGVTPLMASARALAVFDAKWNDRRNRQRQGFDNVRHAARAAMTGMQRDHLATLVWSAAGRWLRPRHVEGALAFTESRLRELSTIVVALQYAASTGHLHQTLDDLRHVIGDDDSGDAAALASTAAMVRSRAATARQLLADVTSSLPRSDQSVDVICLRSVFQRVDRLLTALERTAVALEQIAPLREHGAHDVRRLLCYSERALRDGLQRLAPLADGGPWDRIRSTVESWVVESSVMSLEIVIAADPGPETLPVGVGVESIYPFYQEASLHASSVIRDGRPHAYPVELPLSLLGDVYIHFAGMRVQEGEPLRVLAATLRIPGLPDRVLPRTTETHRSASGVTLAYRSVFAFEDVNA